MSDYLEIPIHRFDEFFVGLYGRRAFGWQVRLAERACHGDWPRFLQLPTSSGKTSCLDIAIFALAYQAWRRHATGQTLEAPRRVFFVVDRRIIVNEAFQRAAQMKAKLREALEQPNTLLFAVAWWLRELAGQRDAPPLDCFELRGGIYRDDAWARSPLQPTIVTSTVDQVGSRLLFRGYGVSDRNLAIHAALTANDALILLDEAHCSNPFRQTMAAISRYRDAGLAPGEPARWAEQPLGTPFRFIEMTATPPADVDKNNLFHLEAADYERDRPLDERHGCAKPVALVESTAKGGRQNELLAKTLVEQAEQLAAGNDRQPRCLRVAIVVNRVECARHAFELLRKKVAEENPERVELMIGRMRPIDRDRLTQKLQERFQSGSDAALAEPHFVVATQCLEVGADFDFDAMVCQAASLDALRQRFGRLNRLGHAPHARGVIVMAEGDKAPRTPDPIYGAALPATWEWLGQQSKEGTVDFGVRAMDQAIAVARAAELEKVNALSAPRLDAPVLMPAHLDLLAQTAPRPALEPEVAPYLHGPQRGVPDVRVCWRADLPVWNERTKQWLDECAQTLDVCPPSSAECLSVPLPLFRAWLHGEEKHAEDAGDLLGEQLEDEQGDEGEFPSKTKSKSPPKHRRGVIWHHGKCQPVSGVSDEWKNVFSNALVVLPATAGGWTILGHIPNAPLEPEELLKPDVSAANAQTPPQTAPQKTSTKKADRIEKEKKEKERVQHQLARIDVASAAFRQARDRHILRVHENLLTSEADKAALAGLREYLDDENRIWRHDALDIPGPGESDSESALLAAPTDLTATEGEASSDRAALLRETRAALARCAKSAVRMVRYPEGFVVTGPRIAPRLELPRASFDDEFDEHNLDAEDRIRLDHHLADVAAETERLVKHLALEPKLARAIVAAAERHDLGKADPRFQAMLLGSSLDVAAMQPTLWAKSARGAGGGDAHGLPHGFRHEMLSVELVQRVRDDLAPEARDLMLHAIAAHHGHARPWAPVVVDNNPPDVDLRHLFPSGAANQNALWSSAQRQRLPAHRLDAEIGERYWKLQRRFGWWGLAWLESLLRLADWIASAQPALPPLPARGLELFVVEELAAREKPTPAVAATANGAALVCVGLNGANPLGFLAALGLFRHLAKSGDGTVRLQWGIEGGNWCPTFLGLPPEWASEAKLLDWLFASLLVEPARHGLVWLNQLPPARLELARPSEYSMVAEAASLRQRESADWLSCNGADLCEPTNFNQLQTARRDYFPESATAIIAALTRDQLERALFRRWDYADPIQKVSLHLEPREDRRHAYQWHKPVGDPTRAVRGGMVGANRLAMEAWPFFQSIAVRGELQTVGFQGTRPIKGIRWTWPLWMVPLGVHDITPVLNLADIQADMDSDSSSAMIDLAARGIATAFRLRRILVEKTPNFTPPVALFTNTL